MSITLADIRIGDKLKVTWEVGGCDMQLIGKAAYKAQRSRMTVDPSSEWKTQEGMFLTHKERKNQQIELLERVKTPEEILQERRDKLAETFSVGSVKYQYHNLTPISRNLIDYVIKLEDSITKEDTTK